MNYTLQAPYCGDLYVTGLWATDSDRENYKMEYDEGQKVYHKKLLQKQGYYNYQFLTEDYKLSPTEGSFYQTQNHYQVLVYYRQTGDRTWRLVGYKSIDFR